MFCYLKYAKLELTNNLIKLSHIDYGILREKEAAKYNLELVKEKEYDYVFILINQNYKPLEENQDENNRIIYWHSREIYNGYIYFPSTTNDKNWHKANIIEDYFWTQGHSVSRFITDINGIGTLKNFNLTDIRTYNSYHHPYIETYNETNNNDINILMIIPQMFAKLVTNELEQYLQKQFKTLPPTKLKNNIIKKDLKINDISKDVKKHLTDYAYEKQSSKLEKFNGTMVTGVSRITFERATGNKKYFDFIRLRISLPTKYSIPSNDELIKQYKNERNDILASVLDLIGENKSFIKYDIPLNYFALTRETLLLNREVEYIFELKDKIKDLLENQENLLSNDSKEAINPPKKQHKNNKR